MTAARLGDWSSSPATRATTRPLRPSSLRSDDAAAVGTVQYDVTWLA